MFFIAAAVLILILLLLYKRIPKEVVITKFHIYNLLLVASIAGLILLIMAYPKVSFAGATSGVSLWFNIVIPSLLPFLIASELLIGLGFVNFLGALLEPFMRKVFNVPGAGSFALAMGLTSGNPTGAKVTTSLREKGLCTKTEGERLLTFTNNAGPLFIIGAVSVGMFNNPHLGLVLALAHYTSSITVGILFRFYKRKDSGKPEKNSDKTDIVTKAFREMFSARKEDGRRLGILLGDCVRNSINLLLLIGGFIIFFSVIISLLTELHVISTAATGISVVLSPLGIDETLIRASLSGLLEITTGTKLAAASSAPFIQKILAAAFIIGWAGLSVHLQVISIVSKTDMSPLPYIAAKFFHGIIAAVYTYVIFSYMNVFESISVFDSTIKTKIHWSEYLMNSSQYLAVILGMLLILGVSTQVFKKRSV